MNLPNIIRTILAFAFVGAVLIYGGRLAQSGAKKIAGGV